MLKLVARIAVLACLPLLANASPQATDLPRIEHAPAALVIVDANGNETTYSPDELENYETYRLSTTTPWRDAPAEFDGILLKELLSAHGLSDVEAILVTAENDYTATIPRSVWQSVDVLVATRVDGKPHSRRARGPIQFVIDHEAFEASEVAQEDHLVWMAARIEAFE